MINFDEMNVGLRFLPYEHFEYKNMDENENEEPIEVDIKFNMTYDKLQTSAIAACTSLIINEKYFILMVFQKTYDPIEGYECLIILQDDLRRTLYRKNYSILSPQDPDDIEDYKNIFVYTSELYLSQLLTLIEEDEDEIITDIDVILSAALSIEIHFGKVEEEC